MIDEHDTERIAAALNQLRPDWPIASLRTFIAKNLAGRARRDVCVALAWIACEPGTATPARVLENGPWWKAAGVTGEIANRHPKPGEACHTCGRAVHAPDLVCDQPTQRPEPSAAYSDHAAAARVLLHTDEGTNR